MERKRLVFFGGAIMLLLIVSLFIYPQIIAQNNGVLTQAEFIDILMQVMGLESSLPEGATLQYKINFLSDRGYLPLPGWQPDEILTKEDVAALFVAILRIPDVRVGEYVQAFADRGCMTTGGENDPMLMPDLVEFIDCLSRSEIAGGRINPYRRTISPTHDDDQGEDNDNQGEDNDNQG